MQSSVNFDVMWYPKVKFLQVGKLGAGFCLNRKYFSFVKKCEF